MIEVEKEHILIMLRIAFITLKLAKMLLKLALVRLLRLMNLICRKI